MPEQRLYSTAANMTNATLLRKYSKNSAKLYFLMVSLHCMKFVLQIVIQSTMAMSISCTAYLVPKYGCLTPEASSVAALCQ